MVTLVAAMSQNGVIGDGERMPWHLPGDLASFRRITWGHPMIMGRRTFQTIGKPLPGRTSVVLTRDPAFRAEGCLIASSWDHALVAAKDCPGGDEIMVVGGGEVYRLAMPVCQRLHLTRVEGWFDGSVQFPDDFAQTRDWRVVREEFHPPDARNSLGRSYFLLESPGLVIDNKSSLRILDSDRFWGVERRVAPAHEPRISSG